MRHLLSSVRAPAALSALLCAAVLGAGPARSQEAYPSRPVTLVVPYPAGGIVDIIGRSIGTALSKQLQQPVLIDNKGGASGTIGASFVLRAPPDGYTLLVGSPAEQINAAVLMAKPPFDPTTSFVPAGCIARGANVLVVNAKLPVRNLAELIALAKAKPGALNYGSSGLGNTTHLSTELLAMSAGIELTNVPYKGNAPVINDTIAGQVQLAFSAPGSVLPHIQSGALRPIAVTASQRIPALPSVPTLKEAGLPVEIYSWLCLMAAAKTPEPVMDRLQNALGEALKDPEFTRMIEGAGWERFPVNRQGAARFIAEDRKMWTNLIRSRNLKAE